MQTDNGFKAISPHHGRGRPPLGLVVTIGRDYLYVTMSLWKALGEPEALRVAQSERTVRLTAAVRSDIEAYGVSGQRGRGGAVGKTALVQRLLGYLPDGRMRLPARITGEGQCEFELPSGGGPTVV